MKFFSPSGLDQLLFESFFRGQRGGMFVDVGSTAHSPFFEQFMDWRGLRIEPAASLASELGKQALPQVHYCSIHAPGREWDLLSEIDFDRHNISVISLSTRDADGKITQFLTKHGYELFATLESELVFKRADFCFGVACGRPGHGKSQRCPSPTRTGRRVRLQPHATQPFGVIRIRYCAFNRT